MCADSVHFILLVFVILVLVLVLTVVLIQYIAERQTVDGFRLDFVSRL